jgi:hypothetical protein
MTGHLVGTLARRGVEAANDHYHRHGPPQWVKDNVHKLPGWGIALMIFTVLAFTFLSTSIEYIIRLVYAHLAMVETPETTLEVRVYQQTSPEDAKIVQNLVEAGLIDDASFDGEESSVIERRHAITSGLKRTRNHITAIAGCSARWRGLPIFMLYIVVVSVSGWILRKPLRLEVLPFSHVIVDVLSAMFAARIHCAWTHKVISMPSDKRMPERLVSRAQWKELMVPTALSAGAHGFVFEGMRVMHEYSAQACEILDKHQVSTWIIFAVAVVPVLIGGVVLALTILLPAYVSLVRKEASLLSPEEETIVPMDRTFGGRIPHIGARLNVSDAWASFTWEARTRLVKLYVKFFFVMAALVVVFAHVMALEFVVAAGANAKDIIKDIQEHIHN